MKLNPFQVTEALKQHLQMNNKPDWKNVERENQSFDLNNQPKLFSMRKYMNEVPAYSESLRQNPDIVNLSVFDLS